MKNLIVGMLILCVAHSLTWLQIQGVVLFKFWREHPAVVALIMGPPLAYMFIISSKYIIDYYSGLVWPNRIIGFSIGIVVFTILTWIVLDEPLSLKTITSLILAISLVLIQLGW